MNTIYNCHYTTLIELPKLITWKYLKDKKKLSFRKKVYTLYKDSDIITYIKINSLRWAGHVIRLEEQNPARRVFAAVVEGRRQKDRPKLRWEDGVKGDAKRLGGKILEEYRKK